jgi:hypothetical protein
MKAMKIAKAGLADQSLKGRKTSEKAMPKSGIPLIACLDDSGHPASGITSKEGRFERRIGTF